MTSGPTRRRVVLATRNRHKVAELQVILADVCDRLGLEVVGLDDYPGAPDVVEDGVTFEENALRKAVSAAEFTGLPALADDSGISVDVLGGAPGIFSARWSGGRGDRANLELLLAQLADVRDEHRSGAFVCAAALALPDGTREVELGRLTGTVVREPRGSGGFGYDPVFAPDGSQRTVAEYAAEEKNEISHRALAFRALAAHLQEHLST